MKTKPFAATIATIMIISMLATFTTLTGAGTDAGTHESTVDLSPQASMPGIEEDYTLTVSVTYVEPVIDCILESEGDGTAEWTTDQAQIGSYSVELYVSDGTTDWAEVSIPVDIAIEEIAESFAIHFGTTNLVITTEQKPQVLNIFRKFAKKFGTKLVVINHNKEILSTESIDLIDYTLKFLLGKGLTKKETNRRWIP